LVGGGVGSGIDGVATDGRGVGVGAVLDGGGDDGCGVALVGAAVGATVLIAIEMLGSAEADDDADALGDADPVAFPMRPPPRNSSAMATIVRRLPASAASTTSIHLGPRRGGGMSLVVSPGVWLTRRCVPRTVPV
jgi:hypothetical protein